MKKKSLIKLALMPLALFMLIVPVSAIPNGYKLSVPNVKQAKSNWCWAAASEASLRFSGITGVNQTNVVVYVKGANVNQMATMSETQSGLTHFGASSTYAAGDMPFADIISETYTLHRPMIAGLYYSSLGYGHIVVVKGYYYNSTTQTVVYMDPWTGTEKADNYSAFDANWVETLYGIH